MLSLARTYASVRGMNILGIETSCDDTGVAVVEASADGSFVVRSNNITPQDHRATGGVVPEVAARHHATAIIPTLDRALDEAHVTIEQIDAIAVTRGPGLIACLLVGVETAKTISVTRHIPIIGVNHMAGHIASTFVEQPSIHFPVVVLLASGGHTMLVGMRGPNDYFLIGTTRDDAAGEAFDKVAKMLGLSYPGGPEIARLAAHGDPHAVTVPTPMIDSDNFDFSFSGLKTSVLYHIRDHQPLTDEHRADIAASVQQAIVDVLVSKTLRAATLHHAATIILGGGVSANAALRDQLTQQCGAVLPYVRVVVPTPGLFTDNGAMIAIAAAARALQHDFDDPHAIRVDPNLKLTA